MQIRFITCLLFFIASLDAVIAKAAADGRYIQPYMGYGNLSSKLTGSGFNSELPTNGGLVYGLEVGYQDKGRESQYSLKYEKISVDQNTAAGITPNAITIYREEIRFLYSFAPWEQSKLDKLRFQVGYAVLTSGGSNTSPNNILTKQQSRGVLLGTSYIYDFPSNWKLTPQILFYLPHSVKESQQVTGYNVTYLGIELKVSLDYVYSDKLTFNTGITLRNDTASFDGSVDRGVTNGKDSRDYFFIPVGVKFNY